MWPPRGLLKRPNVSTARATRSMRCGASGSRRWPARARWTDATRIERLPVLVTPCLGSRWKTFVFLITSAFCPTVLHYSVALSDQPRPSPRAQTHRPRQRGCWSSPSKVRHPAFSQHRGLSLPALPEPLPWFVRWFRSFASRNGPQPDPAVRHPGAGAATGSCFLIRVFPTLRRMPRALAHRCF